MSVTSVLAGDAPRPVSGLVGLNSATGHGWLAIRVDFPVTNALNGVVWYNNDESQAFPQLLVGMGHPERPGLVADALPVAEEVTGLSSAWSEVAFVQPVAATLGGLYVIFEFPAGSAFAFPGTGGGPAVGYAEGDEGSVGWISGDGETWMRLADSHRFCVVPVLVPYEEGMAVLRLVGGTEEVAENDAVRTPYLSVGPSPFNPKTEIRFGLVRAVRTTLDVFNVRGWRVVRLVDDVLPAGRHQVTWTGRDQAGRQVASGVYFARLKAGAVTLTRRMVVVR